MNIGVKGAGGVRSYGPFRRVFGVKRFVKGLRSSQVRVPEVVMMPKCHDVRDQGPIKEVAA